MEGPHAGSSNCAQAYKERRQMVSCAPQQGSSKGPRETHLLAAQDFGKVDVEEVDVETGLDEAGDDGDWIDRVLGEVPEGRSGRSIDSRSARPRYKPDSLSDTSSASRTPDAPEDPVRDVEPAVDAERREVVRRDRLCLARPLQHKQLGEDRDRLEVDREGPENLGHRILVGDEEREERAGPDQVLEPERVDPRVLRRAASERGRERVELAWVLLKARSQAMRLMWVREGKGSSRLRCRPPACPASRASLPMSWPDWTLTGT